MSDQPIIVPGPTGVHLVTPAFLLPDDREVAWAGAKKHIVTAPDRAFVMGRFVHAGPPANENGHLFHLEQLETAHKLIPNTPLNMLHQAQHVVGAFIASELLFPTQAASATDTDPYAASPWVETLAVQWRFAFPDEHAALRAAHDKGMSFFSMETIPEKVSCPDCGHTATYDGMSSDSYCDHMANPPGTKWLENPLFVGGALVLPPALPGWKGADITEIAGLVEAKPAEAGVVLDQIVATQPHLEPAEAEALMAMLLAGVFHERPERAVIVAPLWDRLTGGTDVDLIPPIKAQQVAQWALEGPLNSGIKPKTIARARGLADGLPRPPATIHAMVAFFDAWASLKTRPINTARYELYGGQAGERWAREKAAELEAEASRRPSDVAQTKDAGHDDGTETASHKVDRSGVITAHTPPADVLEALVAIPGVTEPVDQLHMAITFIEPHPHGHTITDGDDKATLAKVTKAVEDFAATTAPFSATIDGLGRFELSDGLLCTYATVDAPALGPLRIRLRETLIAAHIPVSDQRGWTPRVILAYHQPGAGPDEIPNKISWTVESMSLWWGAEHVPFDLKART